MPTYPSLFILIGAVNHWFGQRSRSAVDCFFDRRAWYACSTWRVNASATYPHYLAYFNQIAGGPGPGATKHLVDSSLDWGQDLPGLKRWLKGTRSGWGQTRFLVYLAYFGTGQSPTYYHIHAADLWSPKPHPPVPLTEGVYCIRAVAADS